MGGVWKFIGSKSNRARVAWLGGGATEISVSIVAGCGSVAVGGSVSGATITAGGPANSDCAAKPK
jgi:hypothetical protein